MDPDEAEAISKEILALHESELKLQIEMAKIRGGF
jgi:hypothetical protein